VCTQVPMTVQTKAVREKQSEIRNAVGEAETETGIVTFPDKDTTRVQIMLTNGEFGVDIPNALNGTVNENSLNWNIVKMKGSIVEFER